MTSPASNRLGPAPAIPVLAGLTALVLAGHWFALGGQLPGWWGGHNTPSPHQASVTDTVAGTEAASATNLLPPPAPESMPVRVAASTVRWIAPAPPPPAPTPPPPPKKVVKAPVPPPDAPEPDEDAIVETLADFTPSFEVPVDPMQGLEALVPTESNDPIVIAAADVSDTPTEQASLPNTEVAKVAPTSEAVASGGASTATSLPAAQLPPSAQLIYDVASQVKGFTFSAGGQLDWAQDGSTYEARLKVSAFLLGSIVQTSTGRVSATGLAPDRFIDKRRSEKTAEFDRTNQSIRYSSNGRVEKLLAGAQDQVSISLQLGGLLNANPQYTEGQTLSLPVSGANSAEPWHFDIGPESTLELPAGPLLTRVLTRQPRHKGDKKVQIWLAPALENLPVRIRISESNGDYIDQLLEEMPTLAATVPAS